MGLKSADSKYNDPSIMSKFGNKKDGQKCSNWQCYARGSETNLKVCARCKIVKYCSRECQVAHWKQHKSVCETNAGHDEEIARADASPPSVENLLLPPGVNFAELDRRLEKWIKFHNSTLMAATIHALELPRDITRSRTHIVRMTVIWRLDHNDLPGKYFRVLSAEAMEISVASQKPGAWKLGLEQIAELRVESERMRRGTVAAIGVECPPLGAQFVPFGSLRDLSPLRILPNWQDILKKDVENGKKFTRFGS